MPAAYRVFFRHIGLDPDVAPTPIEEAMLARMLQGGFISSNLLADALLIALVDTGVPVWALAAAAVDGPLGIRASRAGEPFGARSAPAASHQPACRYARRLPARASASASLLPVGRLVVADALARSRCYSARSLPATPPASVAGEVVLFSLQVPGVPSLHVEEALWMSSSMLKGPW